MKNILERAMCRIQLDEGQKQKMKNACLQYESKKDRPSIKGGFRLLAIASAAVLLCVGAFAASRFIRFDMEIKDDEVRIYAELSEEMKDTEEQLRAWNSDAEKGEISIRLEFSYMPSDMAEDETATHKYGGNAANRAITFVGHDLRRTSLDTVIENISSAEYFSARGRDAYLLVSDSISVYNKDVYVLFEEEDIVIHGIVGYGITVDEVKSIVSGMSISETDDSDKALPIGNEVSEKGDSDIPLVFYREPHYVYREDLLGIGDVGTYENGFESCSVTVEGAEIFDSLAGFSDGIIRFDFTNKFTDEKGSFTVYNRTEQLLDGEIVPGVKPKWVLGETVEMIKRFVLVTVETDSESARPFLCSFSLGGIVLTEENTIERTQGRQNFLIDGIPGENADSHEPIYIKNIGKGKWQIGYLLDSDEINDELYFYNSEVDIHFALNICK